MFFYLNVALVNYYLDISSFLCLPSCFGMLIHILVYLYIHCRENYGHSELQMERHPMPPSVSSAIGSTDWNEALDIIAYGSPEQVCYQLLPFLVDLYSYL